MGRHTTALLSTALQDFENIDGPFDGAEKLLLRMATARNEVSESAKQVTEILKKAGASHKAYEMSTAAFSKEVTILDSHLNHLMKSLEELQKYITPKKTENAQNAKKVLAKFTSAGKSLLEAYLNLHHMAENTIKSSAPSVTDLMKGAGETDVVLSGGQLQKEFATFKSTLKQLQKEIKSAKKLIEDVED